MLIIGMIAAFLAAALHVFIFYIESFAWTTRALSVFGMDRESAEATKEMAFNQGFYNLFLAIETFVGLAFYYLTLPSVGLALLLFGVGSMLAAALLLFVTSPGLVSERVRSGVSLRRGRAVALRVRLALQLRTRRRGRGRRRLQVRAAQLRNQAHAVVDQQS